MQATALFRFQCIDFCVLITINRTKAKEQNAKRKLDTSGEALSSKNGELSFGETLNTKPRELPFGEASSTNTKENLSSSKVRRMFYCVGVITFYKNWASL